MEELIARLNAYGRFLELEDQIPYWEQQLPEKKARIRELQLNRDSKEIDLKALENPGFFQRLLGRTEEKKEKRNQQLREVTAALNAAQWELKDLEKKIEASKQELRSLQDSQKAYEQAKQGAVLNTAQESHLMMQEIAAFLPAALSASDRILETLEDARIWMQEDALSRGVSSRNRKLECLQKAEENALRLCEILGIMPEGVAPIGRYLQSPGGYITGVTNETAQLDRLNLAIDQIRETRNQLRMLQ